MANKYLLLFLFISFFSCNEISTNENRSQKFNELLITKKGDTLEHGFWSFNQSVNGVAHYGLFDSGYKLNNWIYKFDNDSIVFDWDIYRNKRLKINIPFSRNKLMFMEMPVVFYYDMLDSIDNTYVVLLEYDLNDMNKSIYNYLYQSNQLWESDTIEILKSRDVKKYTFQKVEVFKISLITNNINNYSVNSFVFSVNGFLYDLTLKDYQEKIGPIQLEVFNNMLYSFECSGADIFNYSNKKYIKKEVVLFNDSITNKLL